NAATAVACLEHFPNLVIEADALAQGLITAEWPARLQHLTKGSLVESLPSHWQLWLDGGHNVSAGEILAEQIKAWKNESRERAIVVVSGMMNTKNPEDFYAPMKNHVSQFYTVTIPNEDNAFSSEDLARLSKMKNVTAMPSVR